MDYATVCYLSATAKHELRIPPSHISPVHRFAFYPDLPLDYASFKSGNIPPIEYEELQLELVQHEGIQIWAGYSKRADTLMLAEVAEG